MPRYRIAPAPDVTNHARNQHCARLTRRQTITFIRNCARINQQACTPFVGSTLAIDFFYGETSAAVSGVSEPVAESGAARCAEGGSVLKSVVLRR